LGAVAGDAGAVAGLVADGTAEFDPVSEPAADRGHQARAVDRAGQRSGDVVVRAAACNRRTPGADSCDRRDGERCKLRLDQRGILAAFAEGCWGQAASLCYRKFSPSPYPIPSSRPDEMPRPPRIPQRQPNPPRRHSRATPDASLERKLQEAIALYQHGRLIAAKAICEEILIKSPDNADSLHMLGLIDWQSRNFLQALEHIDRAIAINPTIAAYFSNRGNVLKSLMRLDEALASHDRAIALSPRFAEAHNNRGNVLRELGRLEEALTSYGKAIGLRPDYASAYSNRGNILKNLGRPDEALKSFDRAIALQPDNAEAYNNRGNALRDLQRLESALENYDAAIALRPNNAEAHNNRGHVLKELGRPDDALASYEKAIGLRPDYASAHNNLGNLLRDLGRQMEALSSYDTAITIRPDYADALSNRGNALLDLGDPDGALASYDRAVALIPDHAIAHNNRGNALKALHRLEDALAAYERALALDPDCEYLLGNLAHLKCFLCNWASRELSIVQLRAGVESGALVSTPFPLLALIDDPVFQRQAAELFSRKKFPGLPTSRTPAAAARRERMHLAYLSADFHGHATAFLMAELFERHDRGTFELTAISFGPESTDTMRHRLRSAFDHFVDVRGMGDAEAARLCREMGVEIAIDLKGYTTDSRPGILAARCAPIQINYLGYPGTMGAGFIDYIVADRVLITEADVDRYSEKVIWLPGSYQVNDRQRQVSERTFTRHECSLPQEAFVYCSFNNSYKISPETFDSWMRILGRVPGSVLWLFEDNSTAARNLKVEAEKRGIASERLIFASRLPTAEHLARHRVADLFLDTLPCNAHTTASDALWVGLPVLTQMGQSFAARVAASLNNAVGLSDLTTTTRREYEDLAVALATEPRRLAAIRVRLLENRLSCPLFDSERFARNLEEAFVRVLNLHRAGQEARHLAIGDAAEDPLETVIAGN
jgi:predicted O-linked N-acetylglucosamine transferase (SPINDLY family)